LLVAVISNLQIDIDWNKGKVNSKELEYTQKGSENAVSIGVSEKIFTLGLLDSVSENGEKSVYFLKNGKPIIFEIIDNSLDLITRIGQETKKAILDLIHKLETVRKYKLFNPNEEKIVDKKGREYVSFRDPDFKSLIEELEQEPNKFGGLLYVIDVRGAYYCGLTERTLGIRFEEHILDALRGYYNTDGNIDMAGYHKFYDAICGVLQTCYGDIVKLHRELETYSSLGLYDKRQEKVREIYQKIDKYIRKQIIEIHYGTRKLGARESKLIEKFPIKMLIEEGILNSSNLDTNIPEFIALRTNGLNTAAGGAGVSVSLPLYDIAVMIALGFSGKKIAETVQHQYNLFTTFKEKRFIKTIQRKIEDIFGGSYKAQESLLKPIIEVLDNDEQISRHEIYLLFKEAEYMNAWFKEWSYGNEILEKDINEIRKQFDLDLESSWIEVERYLDKREKYYAGISEINWLDWIFKGLITKKDLQNKVKFGEKKLLRIFKCLCRVHEVNDVTELRYKLHKNYAIEALRKGFIQKENEEIILNIKNFHTVLCKSVFKFYYKNAKSYFENVLFKGLSLQQIWQKYTE